MTEIGARAFYECNFTSIIIPDSVTSIGYAAFGLCSRLKTVYYKGTPSQWNSIEINNDQNFNGQFMRVTKYYFSAQTPTAEQWQKSENWWHYDEDGSTIVLWTKNA